MKYEPVKKCYKRRNNDDEDMDVDASVNNSHSNSSQPKPQSSFKSAKEQLLIDDAKKNTPQNSYNMQAQATKKSLGTSK
jgi:hypothetical protein